MLSVLPDTPPAPPLSALAPAPEPEVHNPDPAEEHRPFKINEPPVSHLAWHRFYSAAAVAVGDTLALALALLLATALRGLMVGEVVIPTWGLWLLPFWWIGTMLVRLLPGRGLGPTEELRRTTLLLLSVYAGVASVLFLAQAFQVSRFIVVVACLVSIVTVPFVRMRVRRLLVAFGWWSVPTAIYGAGAAGARIVELMRHEQGLGYDPVVVYDDDPESWGEHIADVPVLGSAELVTPYAPVAVLAMPDVDRARQIELLEGPLAHYRTVLILPDLFGAPSLWVTARDLGGVLGLVVKCNLASSKARLLKRGLDLTLTLLTAPLWVPLCALLTALVWLEDRHLSLFVQERIGQDGRRFGAMKFRTMVPNAEVVLQQKLDEDPALRREWEDTFKLKDDPRVTRIGRLLRRTSLDELPQLLNVLRGEMSIVGPRPLPAYHHDLLPEQVRTLRERVPPGITGLWQVSGRSDIGTAGMEKLDPYYVRNWSPWLDAVILARTARAILSRSGAY